MSHVPAYERDPYLRELATEVVRTGEDGGRPFAVLADTVCYPEGGGQPADRGRLGEVEIVDVQRVEGEIRHVLRASVGAGAASVRLDWARRFDHMQQHTGQHLLTAVAQDRFGWPTTAFHLGEETCDVELDAGRIEPDRLDALEEAVNAEVREARPVTARRVSPQEYATLAVRTRGLPAGHTGDVRLVEIAGVDRNTCGGTHLRSTAEIGCLALLGSEPMRGGTRVFFVAGGRVLRRLGRHEQRTAALRALLGAPEAELVEVARAKLDELRTLEKRLRALDEELATLSATALAARPEALVEAHFDGRDIAFLQRVARALQQAAPAKLVFLTAAGGADACFVVAAGDAAPFDVQAAGRAVAAALGGRGGGSGRLFQGKAPSLAARAHALGTLRASAGAP
jgi:alanyl-tRNA synthetase